MLLSNNDHVTFAEESNEGKNALFDEVPNLCRAPHDPPSKHKLQAILKNRCDFSEDFCPPFVSVSG